ncbi:hypothetical protein, partial [Brucella oryzae]|uniref:hypothetical protein n=1 Tax=Brucella oryzae TaxID=335286 RepID=UPI001ABFFCFE
PPKKQNPPKNSNGFVSSLKRALRARFFFVARESFQDHGWTHDHTGTTNSLSPLRSGHSGYA